MEKVRVMRTIEDSSPHYAEALMNSILRLIARKEFAFSKLEGTLASPWPSGALLSHKRVCVWGGWQMWTRTRSSSTYWRLPCGLVRRR